MNRLQNRILILSFCSLILSLTSVFAVSVSASEDVIWEAGANIYVKYADHGKSKFGKNDHPVELNTEEVETVLTSLKVQEKDKDGQFKSVFSDQQSIMLSRYLTKGLRAARPDQDIVFAIEKSVPRSIFFLKPVRFFVAGRAFYKDNKLNIIIGEYDRRRNDAYEAVYDPTHVGTLHYHLNHGRRAKSSKNFDKAIVTVDGVENMRLNGAERNDWLVIDVKAASQAYENMISTRKKEETARKRKELMEILGSEETERPPGRATVAAPSAAQADRSTPETSSVPAARMTWKELEEGLEALDRLRKKGLINDDDYEAKKQQMLDAVGP